MISNLYEVASVCIFISAPIFTSSEHLSSTTGCDLTTFGYMKILFSSCNIKFLFSLSPLPWLHVEGPSKPNSSCVPEAMLCCVCCQLLWSWGSHLGSGLCESTETPSDVLLASGIHTVTCKTSHGQVQFPLD